MTGRAAAAPAVRGRRSRRGGLVLGAALAAALGWLVADPLLGQRLRIVERAGEPGQQVLEIGLFPVLLLSLAAGLGGWALLAALERYTRRARQSWLTAAVVALVLLFLPLTGSGMTAGTRLWLAVLHLLVAAVLIPGLASTARRAAN